MKKNILKIAAAAAFAIISLAFLSCSDEDSGTESNEVTNLTATRLDESTVRLSWTASENDNIRAFYVGKILNIEDRVLDSGFYTVSTTDRTYYDISAKEGWEWKFSVQTISNDGTYSKGVTVTNSERISNRISFCDYRIDSNWKVYVNVGDVNKIGIEKVCYYLSEDYISDWDNATGAIEISRDSNGYYSFTTEEKVSSTYIYISVKYSDGTEETYSKRFYYQL